MTLVLRLEAVGVATVPRVVVGNAGGMAEIGSMEMTVMTDSVGAVNSDDRAIGKLGFGSVFSGPCEFDEDIDGGNVASSAAIELPPASIADTASISVLSICPLPLLLRSPGLATGR